MPDAQTQLLAVIGNPIEHSLSPVLHNFIFQKLGFNFCYHAFRVDEENLLSHLMAFQRLNFRGINVTLPLKTKIVEYLDSVKGEAAILNAVNTVLFEKNKSIGFNTDIIGFKSAVLKSGIALENQSGIILGAGGVAKAIALGLYQLGCSEIHIFNRTAEKAAKIAALMRRATGSDIFFSHHLSDDALFSEAKTAAILVNATNVGMFPQTDEMVIPDNLQLNPAMLVFDSIYNPAKTKLMKFAEKQGALVMNGIDMLIYQAIAADEIWLVEKIEIEPFYDEFTAKLYEAMKKDE